MRSSTLLLIALLIPLRLAAQDYSLDSYYGHRDLISGFAEDPINIAVIAGGTIDLSRTSSFNCSGFVSDAPDYSITYYNNANNYPLSFFVLSAEGADTVLLVNDPMGNWHCNDDFSIAQGLTAGLEFDSPQEGVYDIWTGVFHEDDLYASAELLITELGQTALTRRSEEGLPTDNSVLGSPQQNGSGTAFIVSSTGHLLTNHHVIADCSALTFQLPGEAPSEAVVVTTNQTFDLALLKTSSTSNTAVFHKQNRLRLGDEIVVYGFPLLGELSSQGNLTSGVISALSGLEDDLATFQISAQIQPGNSGGPVFDRYGAIAGIVVSTANQEYFSQRSGSIPQNVNFAIKASIAQTFLDANNISYSETSSVEPLSTADIAQRAQAMTGALLCYK